MADGMKIGAGFVEIGADMANLDTALDMLPKKVGKQLESTMQTLQASLAKNKLQMKLLGPDDGSDAYKSLMAELVAIETDLKAKLDLVKGAVVAKATALQEAATAAKAAAAAIREEAAATKAAEAAAKAAAVAIGQQQVSATKAAAAAAKQLATDLATETKAYAAAHAAALAKTSAATASYVQQTTVAARGTQDFGYRLLIASQFADDMQYGLRGVMNNIPQLVMAFGGSAGLAGAISIAVAAGKALHDNWERLATLAKSDNPFEIMRAGAAEYIATLVDGTAALDKWTALEKTRADASKGIGKIHAQGVDEKGASLKEAAQDVGGGDAAVEILMRKLKGKMDAESATRMRGELSILLQAAIDGDAKAIADIEKRAKGTSFGFRIFDRDPERVKQAKEDEKKAADAKKAEDDAADMAKERDRAARRDRIDAKRDEVEAAKEAYDKARKVPDTAFSSSLDDVMRRVQVASDRPAGEDMLKKQVELHEKELKVLEKIEQKIDRQDRDARLG